MHTDIESSSLIVYKASAGSGKTFTLAIEYMLHLLRDPMAYKHILAVTFTNKATGEMKERILGQLFGISCQDPESEAYLKALKLRSNLSEEVIRTRAKEALEYMLHDYSRFRIETIDSFFQSVMRSLARELNLSPNLNIELDTEQVIAETTDLLLEDLDPKSKELAWVQSAVDENIDNDENWDIRRALNDFGRNLFNEQYVLLGQSLRDTLQAQPEIIQEYKRTMYLTAQEAENSVLQLTSDFRDILDGTGLTIDDLSYKKTGPASYYIKIERGEWNKKDKLLSSRVITAMEDSASWFGKKALKDNPSLLMIGESLTELLNKSEATRTQLATLYNSAIVSVEKLNQLQLLNVLREKMLNNNHEQNRFLLADTNELLHRMIGNHQYGSFVFEKQGVQIDHIMIDEFQDTSRMQWKNFEMLLEEGLSRGGDSLIVGDVKQSIYRWRGGDWDILNRLGIDEDSAHLGIEIKGLNINRRSESHIIDFNNKLFTAGVQALSDKHKELYGVPCDELVRAYQDVIQKSPKKINKGYVAIEYIDFDNQYMPYVNATIQRMMDRVQDLQAQGVELRDIGILVNANYQMGPIADAFDQHLGIPVISDEAFRLDSSLAINILIDTLRYLINGDDSIAVTRLVHGLHQIEIGDDQVAEDVGWMMEKTDKLLPAILQNQAESLKQLPLYNLLEELYDLLKLEGIKGQDAYLFSFFDQVTNYLSHHTADIQLFLQYWDEKLHKTSIPSGELEGIRIMSIHKSKGLAFHTVLIPYVDWTLTLGRNHEHILWINPKAITGNNRHLEDWSKLPLVPINYQKGNILAESIYRNDYLKEQLQLWVDAVNKLYVACTRAKGNLIMWTKVPDKNRSHEESIAFLLDAALGEIKDELGMSVQKIALDEDEKEEGALIHTIFEHGTILPSKQKTAIEEEQIQEVEVINKFLQVPINKPILMHTSIPNIEFQQSNRSAEFIAEEGQVNSSLSLIDRGRILHEIFSLIEKIEDVPKAIERMRLDGIIEDANKAEEIAQHIREAFKLQDVQKWYDGSWRLFNECEILYREQGQLVMRRPDRVMLNKQECIVVDFKFGEPHKSHKKQVKEYIGILKKMGYPKVTGYLWYVEHHKIEACD